MLRLYSPLEDASLVLPWEQREVAGILVGVKPDVHLDLKLEILSQVRRRSLVVLKDQCYSSLLHSIEEVKEDQIDEKIVNLTEEERMGRKVMVRDTRISLTIRHVPKTSKLKIRL